MTEIDNIIGKNIQITNSPVYTKIARKKDFYTNMEFEPLLFYTEQLVKLMAFKVGANKKS